MKLVAFSRNVPGLAAGLCLVASWTALGQATAPDAAFRQEMEERYERLRVRAEETQATQVMLQKRIAAMSDELQSLRQQMDRGGTDTVSRDEFKRLAESVREIDRKREEDRKLILEELRKLANAPLPEMTPPKRRDRETPAADDPPAAGPRKGYEYEVKPGDTIAAIVAAYRHSGVEVTVQQVLNANPNVDPKRVPIGKKLFIPDSKAP